MARIPKSNERDSEIVRRYESGQSETQIASEMAISRSAVSFTLTERGIRRMPGRSRSRVGDRKPLPLANSEIATLYQRGQSLQQIADRCGVDVVTIRTRLTDSGVEIRKPPNPSLKPLDLSDDEIRARFDAGDTIVSIAKSCGVTTNTMYARLARLGLPLRGRARSPRGRAEKTVRSARPLPDREVSDQIILDYTAGMGLDALARKYRLARPTIKKVLDRDNVPIRPPGGASSPEFRAMTREKSDEAVNLYRQGFSVKAAADKLEVTSAAVVKALNEAGVEMRTHAEALAIRHPGATAISDEDLTRRYLAGDSVKGMAEEFRTSVSTLRRRLRNLGVSKNDA